MKVGVTGHQDLQASAAVEMRQVIHELFRRYGRITGICSLAAGADQLAAEAILELGGEVEVVLPCDRYAHTFNSKALTEFNRLLSRATAVTVLPYPEPSESAFLAGGLVVVERSQRILAVWDGLPSRGLGGTADIVMYARALNRPVDVVWPTGEVR